MLWGTALTWITVFKLVPEEAADHGLCEAHYGPPSQAKVQADDARLATEHEEHFSRGEGLADAVRLSFDGPSVGQMGAAVHHSAGVNRSFRPCGCERKYCLGAVHLGAEFRGGVPGPARVVEDAAGQRDHVGLPCLRGSSRPAPAR